MKLDWKDSVAAVIWRDNRTTIGGLIGSVGVALAVAYISTEPHPLWVGIFGLTLVGVGNLVTGVSAKDAAHNPVVREVAKDLITEGEQALAKLTPAEVEAIRAMLSNVVTVAEKAIEK